MVKDICDYINAPKAYLSKLLQDLSRHGLISSTRGPKGGFYLTEENKNQPLITIVEIIDGKKRMESCLLSLGDCEESQPCPLHKLATQSRSKLIKSLQNRTIADFARDLSDKKVFLPQ